MSRHRYIKNLNIDDEMDDDALSDGGEEELTAEQQLMMNDVLEKIHEMIGEEEISGLPDNAIKDTIWYYDFDPAQSIEWCLQEQEKRRAAKERQGAGFDQSLPLFHSREGDYMLNYGAEAGESNGRSRIPLIHLAQMDQQRQWELQQSQQQEQQVQDGDYSSDMQSSPQPSRKPLSIITEKTERSELSSYRSRTGAEKLLLPRPPSSITESSYGVLIEGGHLANPNDLPPLDPNQIPVSPSGSAIHRLSTYEPAPSIASSGSYNSFTSPRRLPSEPVPPIETIPDIPDVASTSAPPPPPPKPVKQSKLAQLASSRATTRSKSSASFGTDQTGSIKTYPGLRPTNQSMRPPSTISSATSTATPVPVPPPLPHDDPSRESLSSPLSSSASFHVRRAIQTAMDLAAFDQDVKQRPSTEGSQSAIKLSSSQRSKAPLVTRPDAPTPSKNAEKSPSTSQSPHSTRPPSKLALLAQAKAMQSEAKKSVSKAPRAHPAPPDHLPPEHTEYLTPIANGPTVTTAITTSYQSLYSLTDPSRPSTSEAPFVVPLAAPNYVQSSATPASAKPSKLAMKIKKAQEKQIAPPPTTLDDFTVITVPPIFLPKSTRSRALPSAFASVLIDDDLTPSKENDEAHRRKKGKEKARDHQGLVSEDMQKLHKHRPQKHKHVAPQLAPPVGFAFDVPSPDDMIFNARRGTSLAEHRDRRSDISTLPRTRKPSTSKI